MEETTKYKLLTIMEETSYSYSEDVCAMALLLLSKQYKIREEYGTQPIDIDRQALNEYHCHHCYKVYRTRSQLQLHIGITHELRKCQVFY